MKAAAFLSGGGAMGELVRSHDWAATPVGPIDQWPQSLLTTLGILLNSRFPMFLWWGDDLIQFYNDAYRSSLGLDGKHPKALGQKAEDCWPEIWTTIKPLIDQVFVKGEATWHEDQLIPIFRNGAIEDVYWTFSYSPVKMESGAIGGVLVTCTETTQTVQNYLKLKESEDMLRFAIEATELGTWDFNPATYKFSGNQRLKDWFGLEMDQEIDLSSAIEVIVDKDRQRVTVAIEKALQYESGGNYDIEYAICNPKTKIEKMVRAKGRAWFDEDKLAYRFNGTLQDITEQYNANVKIKENEDLLNTLIQKLPVRIMFLSGPEMKIILANSTAISSWKKDGSIIGKRLIDVIPELAGQPFIPWLEEVYKTGKPFSRKNYEVKARVNGKLESTYADFWYNPMFNAEGEVMGIISTAIDVTEKVMAQRDMEQSQQKLETIIESAPFPIGVYEGESLRIRSANKSIMDIWGKGHDVVGKLYTEILPELENQEIFDQLAAVYQTGIPFHAKNTRIDLIVDQETVTYYFNYSFTPLIDTTGKVYSVMNTAADVTELNLAKQQVEKSEQNLRNIILQAPVAMCLFKGRNHVIEIANDMMFAFWGRSEETIIGKSIFEGLPEVKGQGFEALLDAVYTTGKTHRATGVAIDLPRSNTIETVYIDYVYEAFRDENGVIAGVMAVVIDVTEQVLIRKKIEEAQERARLAIESADLGTYEVDFATNGIKTSERFDAIWGTGKDVTRKKVLDFIHPDDIIIREKAHQEAVVTGNLHYEARIIHNDAIHWVKVKGKIFYDQQQQPLTLLGIIQDITEQKIFAEELTKQVKERTLQLQRSNDDLLQFAHVASHDLKEPVRKIKMFSNILETEYGEMLPEKANFYLQKVQNATNRMYTMIEGVLAYSTMNSAERPIEKVDLNEVISYIETDLEIMFSQKYATLKKDALPTVEGASVLLYQLFYNLINNALKFSKPEVPTAVSISSSIIYKDEVAFARIVVSDNGIGFDANQGAKIFEAFTRLHAKDRYEGTGLGLALCKKIVQRHHGTITANGIKDEMAQFTIELPMEQLQEII